MGVPNITETAHTLCNILGNKIDIVTIYTRDTVTESLQSLKDQGYAMVVCDNVAYNAARNMGLEAFLMTSGVESIQDAINQALVMCTYTNTLRQENMFLRMIVNDQNSLMVVMDAQGDLVLASPTTPSAVLIDVLHQHLIGIPTSKPLRFYCVDKGILYRISSQSVMMNSNVLSLFYCVPSRIPLNAHIGKGIRYINKNECEFLLKNSFYSITGAMGKLSDEIKTYSKSKQPLMILGELGTGKEQIAKYLYVNGDFSNRPFVMIDCEFLTEKSYDFLLNSDKSPLNEFNVTVYFQNFAAINTKRLSELLSTITETGLIRRLRLIFSCTCHEVGELPLEIFDFMNRLGCGTLILPTLRSSADEISSLANMYLSSLKLESGKHLSGFEPKALLMLKEYSWPDNYTQFKKVLETLSSITDSGYIRGESVAELLHKEGLLHHSASVKEKEKTGDKPMRLDEIITYEVLKAVERNGGNRTKAAGELGISRTTLWRYLEKD